MESSYIPYIQFLILLISDITLVHLSKPKIDFGELLLTELKILFRLHQLTHQYPFSVPESIQVPTLY